jgi:enoyl-[acyl-carrier protein] reductase I
MVQPDSAEDTHMIDLKGKTVAVFGVASDTSIAWAITKMLAEAGADIILGYQFRFKSRVMGLVKDNPQIKGFYPCDVTKEEEVKAFFNEVDGNIDVMIHAIAWAEAATFKKPVVLCTAQEFSSALEISAYSLLRLSHYAMPKMNPYGSIMTLSYLGAERVVPHYHVMGIAKATLESCVREAAVNMAAKKVRVNAISAGPIPTLAAGGIPGFQHMLKFTERTAPLKENITQEDVAGTALWLASKYSKRVTGQTIYVDSGYNIVGVPPELEKLLGSD